MIRGTQRICSFKYLFWWNFQLASKKKEQIKSISVHFLTIYEKCFHAYLLNLQRYLNKIVSNKHVYADTNQL